MIFAIYKPKPGIGLNLLNTAGSLHHQNTTWGTHSLSGKLFSFIELSPLENFKEG